MKNTNCNWTRFKRTIGSLLLLAVAGLLISCNASKPSDKLQVVSTIGMIHDAVLNIGAEHVQASALMGPGVDPHLYKASEGDVRKLAEADLIFYNGLHLESKMGEIFEKMSSQRPVVPVAEAIPSEKLRTPAEFKGMHDPHVWFDVSLWRYAVAQVRDALIVADPKHKQDYFKNAEAYLAKLNELHEWVNLQTHTIPTENRVLITAHDAFGYFGQAYGFEVMGLQGISTQAEAGTKDVQRLADVIVSRKITAIFIESAVPERNIQAVQAAAQARGGQVSIGGHLFADAMGDAGTAQGTYIGMVKHNVTTIVTALSGLKK